MLTTVNKKNMVTIPAEVRRRFGIKPGCQLDWQPVDGQDAVLVRIIPGRGELARRLLGAGRRFSPERDAVAELVAERAAESEPGSRTPGDDADSVLIALDFDDPLPEFEP